MYSMCFVHPASQAWRMKMHVCVILNLFRMLQQWSVFVKGAAEVGSRLCPSLMPSAPGFEGWNCLLHVCVLMHASDSALHKDESQENRYCRYC